MRAITSELVALHTHNTARMMVEVFSGLRTPKPMPPSISDCYYTMGEFVTELPDPHVAKISSHFIVAHNFCAEDLITLLLVCRWCDENKVMPKVFDGSLRESRGMIDDYLREKRWAHFAETLYEMCDKDSLRRIEKSDDDPIGFFTESLCRLSLSGTLDSYDGSPPHPASFIFYTGDKKAPFAMSAWGSNYLRTYLAILGGQEPPENDLGHSL